VCRNEIAVRLLVARLDAGVEAPLHVYVTERQDGRVMLSCRPLSTLLTPYGNATVDTVARRFDATLARIVEDAAGR